MVLRKKLLLAPLLFALTLIPGCIGTFALTREVWSRNSSIENKIGREALFLALILVPVYEVTLIADMLVFNTAELFTDENIWASTQTQPTDAEP